MRTLTYVIFLMISLNATGQVLWQNNTQLGVTEPAGSFVTELNKFIEKVNTNSKMNEYFVFVIRVCRLDTSCISYTIGVIPNERNYEDVMPQYQITDSTDVIIVSFDSDIREKSIPGCNLVKIDSERKEIIKSKLLHQGFITGTFNGLIYKQCGDDPEKIFYENSDLIPRRQSIFRKFPDDVIIKEITKEELYKRNP